MEDCEISLTTEAVLQVEKSLATLELRQNEDVKVYFNPFAISQFISSDAS